jgi:hypothetical protein
MIPYIQTHTHIHTYIHTHAHRSIGTHSMHDIRAIHAYIHTHMHTYIRMPTGRWAHMVCMIYVPETEASDPIAQEVCSGLADIERCATCLCACVCVCVCVYACMRVCLCTGECMYVCLCKYVCVCVYIYIYVCWLLCNYKYMLSHRHIHNIYKHIYTTLTYTHAEWGGNTNMCVWHIHVYIHTYT